MFNWICWSFLLSTIANWVLKKLSVDRKIIQSKPITPSKSSLHLIQSALSSYPPSVSSVLLVYSIFLFPAAVRCLNPLFSHLKLRLITRQYLVKNPAWRCPDVREVPLLSAINVWRRRLNQCCKWILFQFSP